MKLAFFFRFVCVYCSMFTACRSKKQRKARKEKNVEENVKKNNIKDDLC